MKSLSFYFLALLVFGFGAWAVFAQGARLANPQNTSAAAAALALKAEVHSTVESAPSGYAFFRPRLNEPFSRLLFQLILIVTLARLSSSLVAKCGQPTVVGEIVAGIVLGPSFVGLLWPTLLNAAFPRDSLGALQLFSQIGVCLFMFVVGMDLEITHLRNKARTALLISQVSILFPFLLGSLVALALYTVDAGPGVSFHVFALFLGIAVSITAFPVLARIIEERGLTKTPLGAMALVCAAADDVAAWSLLALVTAMAQAHDVWETTFTLGLLVIFISAMLLWVKPRLECWAERAELGTPAGGKTSLVLATIFLCASALTTDIMGIHAIFGAFLAGVVVPRRGELRRFLKLRLEQFSSVLLLPVFFAFTGLRTQLGLLGEYCDWLTCAGIVILATAGKLGGATLTARFTGSTWYDSFVLGALMNTRGLVELIALNLGYDLGIISPRIFTMLVIMALVTTAMTGPLLSLAESVRARRQGKTCLT